MHSVTALFYLLIFTTDAKAAMFEAECRTQTASHAAIVTKVKLSRSGLLWLGEAVILGEQAERLFVRVQDTPGELSFDTSIKRNEKTVGSSDTEILWREENPNTGYPAIDNPEATAHIVMTYADSGAQATVSCSIHQI